MKTRRNIGNNKNYKSECTCYHCVGDIIGAREKTALEQYNDSLEEYELQILLKNQDESVD
jgi:hypothetical protein